MATPAAPDAGDDHPERAHRLVDDAQRVLQRRQRDDRGAVLVVVEDRDVEEVLEAILDLEAGRRRDVLEVDAAEHRGDAHDGLDDLVGGGDVEADREGIDPGEVLEEERLALHHREGAGRADVAEPEHGGAVGDDGDGVLLDRELVGQRGLLLDRGADPGHARACTPSRGRRGRRSACGRAPRSCRPRASRRCGRRPRAPRRRRRRAPPRSPARCAPRSEQLTSTSSSRWAPADIEAADGGDVAARRRRSPVARWPRVPGRLSSRTRRRMEYAAVGVAMGVVLSSRSGDGRRYPAAPWRRVARNRAPSIGARRATCSASSTSPGSCDISSRQRRISDALKRRCPPRVRIAVSLPERAQRVTVLGLTRNSAATSLGVSRASGASRSSCCVMVFLVLRFRRPRSDVATCPFRRATYGYARVQPMARSGHICAIG